MCLRFSSLTPPDDLLGEVIGYFFAVRSKYIPFRRSIGNAVKYLLAAIDEPAKPGFPEQSCAGAKKRLPCARPNGPAHWSPAIWRPRQCRLTSPMKRLTFGYSVVLFALLGAAPLAAMATGTISGTIIDARNGNPVANAVVRVGYFGFMLGFVELSTVAPATTDDNGQYAFESVPAGSGHLLRIEPPSPFLWQAWPSSPCLRHCNLGQFSSITLRDGEAVRADAAVTTSGTISGTIVRDADQLPVVGARVTIQPYAVGVPTEVSTDSEGRYRVPGLPPGSYRVLVSTEGQNLLPEAYDDVSCVRSCFSPREGEKPVVVLADGTASEINFGLSEGATIAGSIRESGFDSLRIPTGLRLQRVDGAQSTHWSSKSLAAGTESFAFVGLPAGSYRLAVSGHSGGPQYASEVYDNIECARDECTTAEMNAGTPIAAVAGQEIDDIEIEVERAASIAGCVLDAATNLPISGVQVIAYTVIGGGGVVLIPFQDVNHATTGVDGCYRIDALPESDINPRYLRTFNQLGFVDQLFLARPCPGGACLLNAGTPIFFGPNAQLSGYDFSLQPGAAISGTVRAFKGGAPVEGATISLNTASGVARYRDYMFTTSADGSFRTYGLADGTYFLEVLVPPGRFGGRYVYGAINGPGQPTPPVTSGTPILIEFANGAPDIEIVLDPTIVHFNGFE